MVKKVYGYGYSFWQNSRTWQTDRHACRQTDTAWRNRSRLQCTSSRRESSWPRRFERRNKCQQFNSALHGVRPTDASPGYFCKARRRIDGDWNSSIIMFSVCWRKIYGTMSLYFSKFFFKEYSDFLPCDAMHKRGYCRHAVFVRPSVRLSVCPSVRLSRSWVAPKRIKISSNFFHYRVAKPF